MDARLLTKINKRIKEISDTFSTIELLIFEEYFIHRHTHYELANNKKIHLTNKHGVSILTQRILKKFKSDTILKKYLQLLFLENPYDYLYLDSRIISKEYARVIVYITKSTPYSFRIIEKHFLTTNHNISKTSVDKYFNKHVMDFGLPVFIQPSHQGMMDEISFYFHISQAHSNHWIISSDEKQIIGKKRLGFMKNVCFFQKKAPLSLWTIYALYLKECPQYLKDYEIDNVEKLSLFIRKNMGNFQKDSSICRVKRIAFAKEVNLTFPLYEINTLSTTKEEIQHIIGKIEKNTKDNGLL